VRGAVEEPRFQFQSDGSRSQNEVDFLLDIYSLEIAEGCTVCKFDVDQKSRSRARKTAMDMGLEFRCGTALATSNGK